MKDKIEVRALTDNDIYGYNKLHVFKNFSWENIKTPVSDFCLLTGAKVYEDQSLIYASRLYVTYLQSHNRPSTDITIRPIIKLPEEQYEELLKKAQVTLIGYKTVYFGKYPKGPIDHKIQSKLNEQYRLFTVKNLPTSILKLTGEHITLGDLTKLPEYKYEDKYYVRVKANNQKTSTGLGNDIILNDGSAWSNGDYVWVQVRPIRWIVDEKEKLLIASEGLFSGFSSKMNIDKFLTEYFYQDLVKERDILKYSIDKKHVLKETSIKAESPKEPDNMPIKDSILKLLMQSKAKIEFSSVHETTKMELLSKLYDVAKAYYQDMKACLDNNDGLTFNSLDSIKRKYIEIIASIEMALIDPKIDAKNNLDDDFSFFTKHFK